MRSSIDLMALRKTSFDRFMSAEIEMRWIDVWNDLYDLISKYHGGVKHGVNCLLPDGRVVNIEECELWLQDSAYDRYYIKVEHGWVLGKPGIIASRLRSKQ
jgi:hypothetical protein